MKRFSVIQRTMVAALSTAAAGHGIGEAMDEATLKASPEAAL